MSQQLPPSPAVTGCAQRPQPVTEERDADETLAKPHAEVHLPEAVDPSDAPPIVKHRLAIIAHRIRKFDGVTCRVSRTPRGGWCIGIYFENSYIELGYSRHAGKWTKRRHKHVRLVLDGEDRSDEFSSVEEAFQQLIGGHLRPNERGQIGQPGDAKSTTTSVQVRNTAVIRN